MRAEISRQTRMDAFDMFSNLQLRGVPRKAIIDAVHSKFGIPAGTLYDWYSGNHIPYGRKGEIAYQSEIYYVIGALLGDGCLYKWKPTHNYVILVGDKKFAKKYARFLTTCIGKPVKPYIDRAKQIWFARTNNFELYELFRQSRINPDHLANLIVKTGKRAALLFIEGFFDAEGCVKIIKEPSRKTPKICLDVTNTNLEILNLLKGLLVKYLGIKAKYSIQKPRRARRATYHLRIYKKRDVRKFLEPISTTKLNREKALFVKNWLNKN